MPNMNSTVNAFQAKADEALVAADRHRAEAMRLGFSDDAAEAMAVSLHSVLLAKLLDEEDAP